MYWLAEQKLNTPVGNILRSGSIAKGYIKVDTRRQEKKKILQIYIEKKS